MEVTSYAPKRGDIVWLHFEPVRGHEQSGRRPALILSPIEYNTKTGRAIVCPVTSRAKGYPFEVLLPKSSQTTGVILADHIRNVDWQTRNCEFIEQVPDMIVKSALTKFQTMIG